MNRAETIIQLYNKHGSRDYIGEGMTQTAHALQCAYHARHRYPDDADIILAALLHDIGHILYFDQETTDTMGAYGINRHEDKGASYLSALGYNERICAMVRNHVAAKRYLCSTSKEYYENLSHASKTTMRYQGGMMTLQEQQEFMYSPYFADSIKIRYLDDMGKDAPGLDYGRIEDYRELLK